MKIEVKFFKVKPKWQFNKSRGIFYDIDSHTKGNYLCFRLFNFLMVDFLTNIKPY